MAFTFVYSWAREGGCPGAWARAVCCGYVGVGEGAKEWVMVTKLALVRTWSRERAWLSQWCAFLAVALPWMAQPDFSPANQGCPGVDSALYRAGT